MDLSCLDRKIYGRGSVVVESGMAGVGGSFPGALQMTLKFVKFNNFGSKALRNLKFWGFAIFSLTRTTWEQKFQTGSL